MLEIIDIRIGDAIKQMNVLMKEYPNSLLYSADLQIRQLIEKYTSLLSGCLWDNIDFNDLLNCVTTLFDNSKAKISHHIYALNCLKKLSLMFPDTARRTVAQQCYIECLDFEAKKLAFSIMDAIKIRDNIINVMDYFNKMPLYLEGVELFDNKYYQDIKKSLLDIQMAQESRLYKFTYTGFDFIDIAKELLTRVNSVFEYSMNDMKLSEQIKPMTCKLNGITFETASETSTRKKIIRYGILGDTVVSRIVKDLPNYFSANIKDEYEKELSLKSSPLTVQDAAKARHLFSALLVRTKSREK